MGTDARQQRASRKRLTPRLASFRYWWEHWHIWGRLAHVHGQRTLDRQAQSKLGSFADVTHDQYVPAMLAKDLSAHREAEARSLRAFTADERSEYVVDFVG